jgi:hypothetical protein
VSQMPWVLRRWSMGSTEEVLSTDRLIFTIDGISRCLTRTATVAAVLAYVVLVTILIASGPHGTGASIERAIAERVFELVGLTSLFSIVASVPAVIIFSCGKIWQHWTIHWYVVVSMMILLLLAMTPAL